MSNAVQWLVLTVCKVSSVNRNRGGLPLRFCYPMRILMGKLTLGNRVVREARSACQRPPNTA